MSARLLDGLARVAVLKIAEFNPQNLANAIWGFASLGARIESCAVTRTTLFMWPCHGHQQRLESYRRVRLPRSAEASQMCSTCHLACRSPAPFRADALICGPARQGWRSAGSYSQEHLCQRAKCMLCGNDFSHALQSTTRVLSCLRHWRPPLRRAWTASRPRTSPTW